MAGKKSHGPRGADARKQAPSVPDSDHVVFTKDHNGPSKKAKEQEVKPAVPQVDTRKVIGGASWTGKLPVNLLSELCQKQKWNKPEYSMKRLPHASGGGFISSVTLSKTDQKTQKITKLQPFQFPSTHVELAGQDTALEARHFAATYALYRVSSMKNIHMTLPPKYKDLWKGELAQLKAEDVKANRAWMYDADPFATAIETKKIRDAMEVQKAKAVTAKSAADLSLTMPGHDRAKIPPKSWERAPRIELGSKIRSDVETLVRSHGIWNPYGIEVSEHQRSTIVGDLSRLGFRKIHVEEAIQECKDREECLHWLLINVPEDDLPAWSFPEKYTTGVSLVSGDLVKEAKIKRLALSGFSTAECALALQKADGDETLAAEALQSQLITALPTIRAAVPEESHAEWQEELDTLNAIYGDRFTSSKVDECLIVGEVEGLKLSFYFKRPSGDYPQACLPIMSVHSENIPAYIRLSATKRALEFASSSLLGAPMIFNLIEWLEGNIKSVIDDPGTLRALHNADSSGTVSRPAEGDAPNGRNRSLPNRQAPARNHHYSRRIHRFGEMTVAQQKMMNVRQGLPAWAMKEEIVRAVNRFQCVIISGETGSGKSTQSVQFILDDLINNQENAMANIVCTQPRRISALGLADRVSEERCGSVGDEVGYIIRGDSRVSPNTRITFMTTGVLLRRLQTSRTMSDSLEDLTHIFVDEVHERGVDTDFLLALLRNAMVSHPHLKVILMSATLEAGVFQSYFGGPDKVCQLHISGRAFPVTDYFIDDVVRLVGSGAFGFDEDAEELAEDETTTGYLRPEAGLNYSLIADLVSQIDVKLGSDPGGILIFLPGTMEIDRCLKALQNHSKIYTLPLHASLTPAEQRKVFPSAPSGMRKVVAATNVAETSITIADIVAVIDTGRVKETSYDPTSSIVRLQEVWASRAACKQRRGRAGRTQPGTCYKMFSRKVESAMASHPLPEIQRLPLEQLCLSVKATVSHQDVTSFLQQTLTPPEDQAIEVAIKLLHRIGALDCNELTALGKHLSMIPADLRCAKLLVYGSIFGCLEACLTISAILTVRNPFVSPRDKRQEAKEARATFSTEHGDLLVALSAYNEWSDLSQSSSLRTVRDWCSEKFLSIQNLRDIASTRSQLLSSLIEAGIVPTSYNRFAKPSESQPQIRDENSNATLLRALIAGALDPQIARIQFPDKKFAASMAGAVEVDPDARTIKYFNQDNGRVFVHPSSVVFDAQSFSGATSFVSYFNLMATSKTFVRDLTPFNAYALLLFGGPIIVAPDGHGLIIDDWLRLRGWARIGVLVSRLRALLDDALRRRIDHPHPAARRGGALGEEDAVIGLVKRLVQFNGQDV